MVHIIAVSAWRYFFNNLEYTLPTGMLPTELQVVKLMYYVLFPFCNYYSFWKNGLLLCYFMFSSTSLPYE